VRQAQQQQQQQQPAAAAAASPPAGQYTLAVMIAQRSWPLYDDQSM